jgi:hypothetical protein
MYIINSPIKVYLHLEEFNKRWGLLHIGISFENEYRKIRYDFKKVSTSNELKYITYDKIKIFEVLYPEYEDDYIPEVYDIITKEYSKNVNLPRLNLYWGITNYTFEEIEEFEKTLHKKYRLGVYDCRHYTRKFSKWALCKPIPVWRLKQLWNKNIDYIQ